MEKTIVNVILTLKTRNNNEQYSYTKIDKYRGTEVVYCLIEVSIF